MGSRSTNIKCALGGFEGRKLKRGDMLALYGVGGRLKPRKPVYAEPQHAYTSNGAPLLIRVADGPQIERFSKETIRKFQNAQYTVSVQSDRMGVRLDGEPLPAIGGADIVSDGIPCGAVQVSNAGQPMILLADRQTVGGYAKPFVVIEADLPLLAQARPGDKLRFARVSIRNAQFAALETIADTGLTLRRIDEQYTGSLRFAGFNIKT
jgi:allophanate hydrolase subunit 2